MLGYTRRVFFPLPSFGRLPRFGNQASYLLTCWLVQKTLLSSRPRKSRLDIQDRDPAILSRPLRLVVGFSQKSQGTH